MQLDYVIFFGSAEHYQALHNALTIEDVPIVSESNSTKAASVSIAVSGDDQSILNAAKHSGVLCILSAPRDQNMEEVAQGWANEIESLIDALLDNTERAGRKAVAHAINHMNSSLANAFKSYHLGKFSRIEVLSTLCDEVVEILKLGVNLQETGRSTHALSLFRQCSSQLCEQLDIAWRAPNEEELHMDLLIHGEREDLWRCVQAHLNELPDHTPIESDDIREQNITLHLMHAHLEQLVISRHIANALYHFDELIKETHAYSFERNAYDIFYLVQSAEHLVEPIYQSGNLDGCVRVYDHVTQQLLSITQDTEFHTLVGQYMIEPITLAANNEDSRTLTLSYQESLYHLRVRMRSLGGIDS